MDELIEKIIEKSAPDSDETWECFETVMKESAKEMGVGEDEFNDFCLSLSEDSNVWEIAAEISILRVKKAIPLIAEEIFSDFEQQSGVIDWAEDIGEYRELKEADFQSLRTKYIEK